MRLAEAEYDVFITVDRNLSYQQNLSQYNIALVVLMARSNRLEDIEPFASKLLSILDDVKPSEATILQL